METLEPRVVLDCRTGRYVQLLEPVKAFYLDVAQSDIMQIASSLNNESDHISISHPPIYEELRSNPLDVSFNPCPYDEAPFNHRNIDLIPLEKESLKRKYDEKNSEEDKMAKMENILSSIKPLKDKYPGDWQIVNDPDQFTKPWKERSSEWFHAYYRMKSRKITK